MNEELKVIIRAEIAQFKNAINDAIQGLKKVANESDQASKEVDGLTADVSRQAQELTELKKKYIDLAAAHGKESKAAQDAANQIKSLSEAYKNNKTLAAELANDANSFDVSMSNDGASRNVENTNASMEDLQGTLESIQSLNFWELIATAFGSLGTNIKAANWHFTEMGEHAKSAFSSFSKNGKIYQDLGTEWTGIGDAIKSARAEGALAVKSFKAGLGEITTGLGTVLSGWLGVAAVIVADLLVIIGLTKNALNVAKELKQVTSEASKLGLEVNTYQEWVYVLKQVGVEADKLSDFLKTLADEQNAVRDGSEDMIDAFSKIGLTTKEVMGSSQEELFNKTVEGLQNIENAALRTSLAYRIFGEDAAELANVLYLSNEETQSFLWFI